jgi:hypothetical protein
MADHTVEQIDQFIQIAVEARAHAERELEEMGDMALVAAQ